jgi:hypothetical protein
MKTLFAVIGIALPNAACVPTLVMIDRTTLIEEESSGDWPDLDKNFDRKSVDFRPSVLPPASTEKRRERAYQVMDGDYSLNAPNKR